VDLWLLGFSLILGGDPAFFGVFLTWFGVSFGFRWVFRCRRVGKVKIVGFGELHVGLGGL